MGHKVSKVQLTIIALVTVFLSVIVLSDFVCDHPLKFHIDSSKSNVVGLTEKKTKNPLPQTVMLLPFIPVQIVFQTLSPDDGNTFRNTFTPSDHLQSRAPPVVT